MELKISYAHAVKRHPDEVKEAIAKLKKSKSKKRLVAPSKLKWKYSWCVQIKSHSFNDIVNGAARRDAAKWEAMTLQERVNDEANRTKVHLTVAGNGYWAPLKSVPDEIMEGIIEAQTYASQERDRVLAMSEKERTAYLQDLLKQLRGPGFVAI